MHWYGETAFSSFKEVLGINAINVIPTFLGTAVFSAGFLAAFGLIVLVESSALMLVGGAMSFGGDPGARRAFTLLGWKRREVTREDYQRAQHRAALYTTAGLMLFAEALMLALAFA